MDIEDVVKEISNDVKILLKSHERLEQAAKGRNGLIAEQKAHCQRTTDEIFTRLGKVERTVVAVVVVLLLSGLGVSVAKMLIP